MRLVWGKGMGRKEKRGLTFDANAKVAVFVVARF